MAQPICHAGAALLHSAAPTGLPDPHWVATSPATAALLGWPADWADRPDWQAPAGAGRQRRLARHAAAGQRLQRPPVRRLGRAIDGRAHLLGELATPTGSMEIQIKGAGLTPHFAHGAMAARVLRPSIREFLCSEAMAALGIPTTRALAVVGSALPVRRERIETGAVVTRVAPSFLRFGHFEHFAHHGEHEALRELIDHTLR